MKSLQALNLQIGCVYLISFQVNHKVFIFIVSLCGLTAYPSTHRYNVLFIISDDLTSTALSCYGNEVCHTPNIDRIAEHGVRFTRAYCQGTYCGPSRASFMSGYYPHAIGALGYKSPRSMIGDRTTWSQHFMNHGYHSARVSKIFHMGVPVALNGVAMALTMRLHGTSVTIAKGLSGALEMVRPFRTMLTANAR